MIRFSSFCTATFVRIYQLFMRKAFVIPAVGLLVVGLSSAFWLVSAADPSETVRLAADVTLHKDSDFLTGFIPARTTIADIFANHMVQNADTPALPSISSIATAPRTPVFATYHAYELCTKVVSPNTTRTSSAE